jgi:alpha,alpha-trehalase
MADPPFGDSARSSTVGGSPFPPIADYGFVSDCEVCALVAPSGNIEWMCLPRMDGPSVFAAMLDRHAGWFSLGPEDLTVPADRRYLAGTMVLGTTWDAPTGWAVMRDVLLIGPWRDDSPAASAHRRTPSDYQAEWVLVRRCGASAARSTYGSRASRRSTTGDSAACGAARASRTARPRSLRPMETRRSASRPT